jgi:hypothetical protein
MEIWIVSEGCECGWYGGEKIFGAYTTKEKAELARSKMEDAEYLSVGPLEVE